MFRATFDLSLAAVPMTTSPIARSAQMTSRLLSPIATSIFQLPASKTDPTGRAGLRFLRNEV